MAAMNGDTRAPIILHAHLFKNAGTSVDWALARCFGERFLDHRDDAAMRGQPAYLGELIDSRPALQALSSHWLPLPVADTACRRVFPIVLLRDPLLRMRSVYAFERRQAVDHPGTQRARAATFRDYVAWRLAPATGPVLRNYQSRMLSGDYPGADDAAQARRARMTAAALPMIGLVERFDETMVLLERCLQDDFPDIDLAYIAQNVSAEAVAPGAAGARAAVEDALGDMRDAAIAANGADEALYREARDRFDADWAGLPNADSLLRAFRARCRALGSGSGAVPAS